MRGPKTVLLFLVALALALSASAFHRRNAFSRAMDRRNRAYRAAVRDIMSENPDLTESELREHIESRNLDPDGNICDRPTPSCNSQDKFRTIDGTCNNLYRPFAGSINTKFARFCPAEYPDGEGDEFFGMEAIDFRSDDQQVAGNTATATGRRRRRDVGDLEEDDGFAFGMEAIDFRSDDRQVAGNTATATGRRRRRDVGDLEEDDGFAFGDLEEDLEETELGRAVQEEEGRSHYYRPRNTCDQGIPNNLPEPRKVSTAFHPSTSVPDTVHSLMVMQFSQFLDHDITRTPEVEVEDCCEEPLQEDCLAIPIPMGDPFIEENDGADCIELTRSCAFCPSYYGVREQFNALTAFVDASNVYGETEELAESLRDPTMSGSMATTTENGNVLLPQVDDVEGAPDGFAYVAGDIRVNENPGLTTIHVLFVREHNRIAAQLRTAANVNLDEQQIYDHTRRIVGAEMQAIVFGQWMETILGPYITKYTGLRVTESMTTYRPYIDPSIRNEFATSAFRFGHTLIQSKIEHVDPESGTQLMGNEAEHCLADNFFNPGLLLQSNGERTDQILAGLIQQEAESYDRFLVDDVNLVLRNGFTEGPSDLTARNIIRGRDHGQPGYNHFRRICGLPRACSWDSPPAEISADQWQILSTLYNHPNDIDLFTAGIAESPAFGGVVGKTFNCLIRRQFLRLKFGDRFFFSHAGTAGSFEPAQFENLRARTLGDIICDNVPGIQTVPTDVFQLTSGTMDCPATSTLNIDLFTSQY